MKHILMRLLAVVVGVAVFSVSAVSSAQEATSTAPRAALVAAAPARTISGHVHGVTRAGATFSGRFTPTRFVRRPHHILARGTLVGTFTRVTGRKVHIDRHVSMWVVKTDFVGKRTSSAAAASPSMAAQAAAAGSCQIVDLVLGPLDLNLLGVVVHLDRVHLNITAQTGPGNLLGNLLCAVAGLLDGVPLTGLLGRVTQLLNRILGALG
jgi:hypothetical protein